MGDRGVGSDASCDFGLLHRLHAPSLGLSVMGGIYEAYRFLQHGMCSYSLFREYVVALAGRSAPDFHTARAPIHHMEATEQALVCSHGKPALTWVTLLLSLCVPHGLAQDCAAA